MVVTPQGVTIGKVKIDTLDLLLIVVFLAIAVLIAIYVVGNADALEWKRWIAIGAGAGSLVAGLCTGWAISSFIAWNWDRDVFRGARRLLIVGIGNVIIAVIIVVMSL